MANTKKDKLTKSPRLNVMLFNMGIYSQYDVINHLPRRYENFALTRESDLEDKERVVIYGHLVSSPRLVRARNIKIVTFEFMSEKKHYFKVVAFNREFLTNNLKINENVVEIGPGKGEISDTIARRVNHLTCIEIDRELEPFINVLKDKHDNVDVIYGSALNVFIPECDKIISALPYSITEPFIEKLLRCKFNEAILIVGKRFADNVIARNHNKLALLTNSFFTVDKIMDIGPDAFDPAPRVMSSMIRLTPIVREELHHSFRRFMFRELFFNRDRKLKNNLMEALISFVALHDQKMTKKESKAIIEGYNLPKEMLNKRIENLNNEEYEMLYNALN